MGRGAAGGAADAGAAAPAAGPAAAPGAPSSASTAAAAAAFAAFDAEVVVDQFARKIGALCVWGRSLIAGVADGSLLFFEEQVAAAADSSSGGGGQSSWQVARMEKAFCKKAVLQLQPALDTAADRAEGLTPVLISLSDDGASLHTLPDLKPFCTAQRSARSTAFAWHPARRELALANRRKVVTHRLAREGGGDGGTWQLQELTTFDMPETAECLAWVGDNIVVGTKRSYYLIAPAPPQSVEVLPGQVVQIYPTVTPQPLAPLGAAPQPALCPLPPETDGEAAAATSAVDGADSSGGENGGSSGEGRSGGPAASATKLLICRDAGSFFIGPDGRSTRKGGGLQWADAPVALAAAGGGYVVGLLPGRIDIKSVSRVAAPAAGQSIPIPGMAVAAPFPSPLDGSVFIAAAAPGGGIRRLRPVSPARQAEALAAAGEFPAALEAAARAAPGPARRRLEDSLRLRFCCQLLAAGEVDDALSQLSMCSGAGPLLLLRLFPDLVPARFRGLLPAEAYGVPLPDLPPSSTEEETSDSSSGEGAGGTSSGAAAAAAAGPSAPARQGSAGGAAGPEGRAAAAVGAVVPYLLSYRTRLMAAMEERAASAAAAGELAAAGDGVGGSSSGGGGDSGGGKDKEGQSAAGGPSDEVVATVLDTALLRAMLTQPDSGAVLRLLQQRNYVDGTEGERALATRGRYAELAALLQYTGQHAKGLELLRALSQDPASLPVPPAGAAVELAGLPGVWAAVRYLTNVSPPDVALVENHAGWLLAADPEAGLEAFLRASPPLPAAAVLPILQRHAPDYAVVYLEAALDAGIASPGDYHALLLTLYLAMALEEEEKGGERPHDAYDRLKALVYSSPHIEPSSVLARLPPGALPEIRALMLERLGRHREALALYCQSVGGGPGSTAAPSGGATPIGRGLEMAEAYCDRVYEAAVAARRAKDAPALAAGGASPPASGAASRRGAAPAAATAVQKLLLPKKAVSTTATASGAGSSGPASPVVSPRRGGLPRLPLPTLPDLEGPPSDIYTQLIEAATDGLAAVGPRGDGGAVPDALVARWRELAAVLSRKANRIDAAKVLSMIPDALPLDAVAPLLCAMLQHATEYARKLSVVRSLRRGENLAAREEQVRAKQRHVTLTADRACCMCHKRIGGSVLVAHPSGQLAHYLCFKRGAPGEEASSSGGGGGGGMSGGGAGPGSGGGGGEAVSHVRADGGGIWAAAGV